MFIGYCRVSTKGQLDGNSIEEQTLSIRERYPTAEIVVESHSGAKERPIFNELLERLAFGDTLIVTKLDRFCRTVKEGLGYIDYLMGKDVKIHILNMGLIENTPMGRLIVTNLLAFAEFERAMIIERTQAGKALAKQRDNFREGRKPIYTPEQIEHALKLLENNSYSQVVKMTGISKSTIIRAKRNKVSQEILNSL
jgi:DNA invertase Pin-like site-specific DNA recombinase